MSRRKRTRLEVKVVVPEQQQPFLYLLGPFGGDFVNLLWNWGDSLSISWLDVVSLLASSKNGSVIIARRMTSSELERFTTARLDADHETHAHIAPNDTARWRRSSSRRVRR